MQTADDERNAYEGGHVLAHDEQAGADSPWHNLVFSYTTEHDLRGRQLLEVGCGRSADRQADDAAADALGGCSGARRVGP